MKRILHCTLIFVVLVMSGCGFFSDESTSTPNANSSPTPQKGKKIDFANAKTHVERALQRLNSPGRSGQPATVKPVKDEIDNALDKLSKEQRALCTECTEETKIRAAEVVERLTQITNGLGKDPQKKMTEFEEEAIEKLKTNLTAQAEELDNLSNVEPKPTENPAPSPSVALGETTERDTDDSGLWNILMLALKIVGAVLALVLIALVLTFLWNRLWNTVELSVGKVLKAHLAATREPQPDYSSKLSSLSSAQAEMSGTLNELNTEVRSLARLVRESIATRRYDRHPSDGGAGYPSYAESVLPKDEPEFPVSAVDYLGRMNRFANVVKPDFQNGILVNDPDRTGELVLIRDSRLPDENQPLFVVPSLTQFHTKQDFYTYYQKYYECTRPAAGDVWIIGPAVVEKCTGGWQLREKGMLEIR